MKKIFLTTMTPLTIAAFTLFGCAGSNDQNMSAMNDNAVDSTHVVVTETEIAAYEIPDEDASVVVAETEVVADTMLAIPARENMTNTNADYGEMFDDVEDTERYGVLELVRMNPNLSTFAQLVEQSGLAASLEVTGPVTIFAPTNEAFEEMSQERYDSLMNSQNQALLVEVLNRHILPMEVSSAQFNSRQYIDREEGDDIAINTDMNGSVIYVGGAQIVKSDVEASNGILHVVNGVIETSPDAGPGPGLD